ncbi:Hypothetical protein A7982_05119 [Minicystis rosea]|nr:Hypothetical protein A7982_05119 [Minicystis rosea]
MTVPSPGTYDDFFGCWADTRFGDLAEEDVRSTCFEPVYGDAAMSASMASSIDSLVKQASDDVTSLLTSYSVRFKQEIATSGGTAGKKIAGGWSAFYPCWATLEVSAPDSSLYGGCWESAYGDLKLPADAEAGVTEIAVELANELDQLRDEYQASFAPIFSKLPTL